MNNIITKGWLVGYFLTTSIICLIYPRPFPLFLLDGIVGLILALLLFYAEERDNGNK